MSSFIPFFELEFKRAGNWLRTNLLAKLLVIIGMLVVISGVLIGEYWMANSYFGYLISHKEFGQAIANYSINAAIFLIFWISAASSWSISNRFLYQTKYLAHVMTAPIPIAQVFNGRLLMVLVSSSWTMWLLIPILLAYGHYYLSAGSLVIRSLTALGLLALSSMTLGVLINMLIVKRLGVLSRTKMMLMGVVLAGGVIGLLRFIFPPRFQALYYAKDWEVFEQQIKSLPLHGGYLPTNWLARVITEGWSGYLLAALLLTTALLMLTWRWGQKWYLATWRRSYQGQLLANTRLPKVTIARDYPYWSSSQMSALVTNQFLGLIRSPAETAYVLFLVILLIIVLLLMRILPGLNRSAPEFIPMVYTIAFTGLIHLWLLLAARVVYPLMAREKLSGWLTFSAPIRREGLLTVQIIFASLLGLPSLLIGLIAGWFLQLPGEVIGWLGLIMLISVLGVIGCQLFWGAIKPNFSEADNPESASTSGSGLAALGWSLLVMLISGYHVYLMLVLEGDGIVIFMRMLLYLLLIIAPLGWWARRSLYGYEL